MPPKQKKKKMCMTLSDDGSIRRNWTLNSSRRSLVAFPPFFFPSFVQHMFHWSPCRKNRQTRRLWNDSMLWSNQLVTFVSWHSSTETLSCAIFFLGGRPYYVCGTSYSYKWDFCVFVCLVSGCKRVLDTSRQVPSWPTAASDGRRQRFSGMIVDHGVDYHALLCKGGGGGGGIL